MKRRKTAHQFDRTVVRRLRKLCLSLPETTETASWGHPNFRAGRSTFVAFEVFNARPSIAFRLDPVNIRLLLHQKQFFATPYGRGKWVSLRADGVVNWTHVAQLVDRSYRTVATERMVELHDRKNT